MKIPIILTLLLIIGVGAFLYVDSSTPSTKAPEEVQETPAVEEEEPAFCIQVITPARNPETGEIREFPTPCDVPEGWEPIAPEGLEFDLEVN